MTPDDLPMIPVSAGALIFDSTGRLLILKPTYKTGWTIPGGIMEADGETPWEACRREVREECGIDVHAGRLACTDFRPARPGRRAASATSSTADGPTTRPSPRSPCSRRKSPSTALPRSTPRLPCSGPPSGAGLGPRPGVAASSTWKTAARFPRSANPAQTRP